MIEIADNVCYTGIKDPALRRYNISIDTPYGTTYNSYIVRGEKCAMIDTAPDKCSGYIAKLPEDKIDYLICTHSEPDLSGNVLNILKRNLDATVVGSIAALRNLKQILNCDFKEQVIKENMCIDLGNDMILNFINIPNLHWPDTAAVCVNKILFSGDLFASHYCEDAIKDLDIWNPSSLKTAQKIYFENTFLPFKNFVQTALKKISDLEIEMICPSHGPVICNAGSLISRYRVWSMPNITETKTAAVVYASAHGYTRKLAETAEEMFESHGFDVTIFDAAICNAEEVVSAVNESDVFILGTPTINRNAAKPIWDIVTSIDMLGCKDKPCFVFGSYGWGGEGVQLIHNCLKAMKLNVFEKPFTCILKPSSDELAKFRDYTDKFIISTVNNIK